MNGPLRLESLASIAEDCSGTPKAGHIPRRIRGTRLAYCFVGQICWKQSPLLQWWVCLCDGDASPFLVRPTGLLKRPGIIAFRHLVAHMRLSDATRVHRSVPKFSEAAHQGPRNCRREAPATNNPGKKVNPYRGIARLLQLHGSTYCLVSLVIVGRWKG